MQDGQVVRQGLREKERLWQELTDGRQRGHHQGRPGFKYFYKVFVFVLSHILKAWEASHQPAVCQSGVVQQSGKDGGG